MYQSIIYELQNIFVPQVFFSVHPHFKLKKGSSDGLKPVLSLSVSWPQLSRHTDLFQTIVALSYLPKAVLRHTGDDT